MMTITIRTAPKFCTRGRAEQPEIFFLDPIHSRFCGCRPQGIMEEEPGRRYLGGIWEPSGSPGRAQGGQESSRRPRAVLDTKSDTPLSYNAKSSRTYQYYIAFLRGPFTLTAYLQ